MRNIISYCTLKYAITCTLLKLSDGTSDGHALETEASPAAVCGGQCDEDGPAVVIFGQPSGDPLQHPRMAQVLAVEVHELAVGWVGHHCRFDALGPTIFRNAWKEPVQPVGEGAGGEDSLNQFSQQLHHTWDTLCWLCVF